MLRQHRNLAEKAAQMKRGCGVDEGPTSLAEYQKMIMGGMEAQSTRKWFAEAGFSNARLGHRWYLAQAQARTSDGPSAEQAIQGYLASVLPLSSNLVKYSKGEATK
jgi:hypothetical protein